jgi:nicotinamide riboside transporter PnuC
MRRKHLCEPLIVKISENTALNIMIAVVCVASGASEVLHVAEQTETWRLHAGHGLLAIGLWNIIQAISNALQAAGYAGIAAKR